MKEVINIEGMGCNHCIHSVQKALETVSGIGIEDVKIGSAVVTYDTKEQLEAIKRVIDDAGYEVVSTSSPAE